MEQTFWLYISKSIQNTGLLRHPLGNSCPMSTKRSLYFSLLGPWLLSCLQILRSCLIKDIVSLERIRRRTTKYCYNSNMDYESHLTIYSECILALDNAMVGTCWGLVFNSYAVLRIQATILISIIFFLSHPLIPDFLIIANWIILNHAHISTQTFLLQ